MSRHFSAALPVAYIAVRLLILLNWISGAAILALLAATVAARDWTLQALGITPESWIIPILPGLQAVAALGLVGVFLNYLILRRLLAIIDTVRVGDPFIGENSGHLLAIAWALLGLQLLSLVIGAIGSAISTSANPVDLDAGFSPSGWLAVLLTFVLARIFAEGAQMREDLEGTI